VAVLNLEVDLHLRRTEIDALDLDGATSIARRQFCLPYEYNPSIHRTDAITCGCRPEKFEKQSAATTCAHVGEPMPLKMDLEKDLAELLRQRLAAADYPVIAGESDEDTFTRYVNVLNRRIERKPRKTKKAPTFTCPPEHQAGLDALIKVSEAGGDMRPYQSTGIEKDNYDDGMLNAWGLHHFHMGTTPHPRFAGFMARTGPLLYAIVTDDTLYCLAILRHQQWSNQQLLDVMDRDFPELTDSSTLKSEALKPTGLAMNYSDADVQKLRDAGVNVVSQRPSGRITSSSGGGVNLSNRRGQKSVKVTQARIDIRNELKDLAEGIDEQAAAAGVPDGREVHLVEENRKLVVKDATDELRVDVPQIVKPL
jgi:hypothetical protein